MSGAAAFPYGRRCLPTGDRDRGETLLKIGLSRTPRPFDVDIPFAGQREPSTVQVVNLRTSIPEPDLAERRKLVTYGEKAWPRLTKQDCWSIAHAVETQPPQPRWPRRASSASSSPAIRR